MLSNFHAVRACGLAAVGAAVSSFCLLGLPASAFAGGGQEAPPVAPGHCVMRDRMEAHYDAVYTLEGKYRVRGLASRFRGSTMPSARTAAAALRMVNGWDKVEDIFIAHPIERPLEILIVPSITLPRDYPGTEEQLGGLASTFCDTNRSTVILMPARYASLDRLTVGHGLTHEIAHAFQSGAAGEAHSGSWYGEASAEFAGFRAARLPRRISDLDFFFFAPVMSLDRHNTRELHEYGAFRFVQWLYMRFGQDVLRRVNHDVFRTRLTSNRDATAELQVALARNLPRVNEGGGTSHPFKIADALGFFWIQHANGEPEDNGERVPGETRYFGSGTTEYWDLSADQLAAVVGRIRLDPGIKTITIRYTRPNNSAELRFWIIDRGNYVNWTRGGSVTYRSNGLGGVGELSNCPDGRPQRETKSWPGEVPFAFTNGNLSSGSGPVRVEITTSRDDEFTPGDCAPSSFGERPHSEVAIGDDETDPEIEIPPGARSGPGVPIEDIPSPYSRPRERREQQRSTQRETERNEPAQRPRRENQREGERERSEPQTRERDRARDQGRPDLTPSERQRLRERIIRDPELHDRTGLPTWIWCLLGSGAAGGALLADIIADTVTLPIGMLTANELRDWLARQRFGFRPDGALLDRFQRPVLDSYGQPVHLRTLTPEFEDMGRGPGGTPLVDRGEEQVGLFDSHGAPLSEIPEFRGGAASGSSYGVLPPNSSPASPTIVPFRDGVAQGTGITFEQAGIRFAGDRMYIQDQSGAWRASDGRTLLEELLDDAATRAADRVIDRSTERVRRRLLQELSDAVQNELSGCNCTTARSSARIGGISSSIASNRLLIGLSDPADWGHVATAGDVAPPSPLDTPVVPGTPPPQEVADDGLSIFGIAKYRLSGSRQGDPFKNCYSLSGARDTLGDGTRLSRVEGSAKISSANRGETWNFHQELSLKLTVPYQGAGTTENLEVDIRNAKVDGVFTDTNRELRVTALSGQVCATIGRAAATCRQITTADLGAGRAIEITPRRGNFQIEQRGSSATILRHT